MINHLSLAKKSWMVDCFCFLVNIFSIFVKYLKKMSSTLSYVSNVWRTVPSASKPSALVGTSFSTGLSSLSEFLPSVSLFNRVYNIIIRPCFSYNQQQLPPMWPRFHLASMRRDKGSSSSSLPDSLSSIFVSSFLIPAFWKLFVLGNKGGFFLSNIIVLNLL